MAKSFTFLSIILLILFSLAIFKDYDSEWKDYQKRFYEIESERGRNAEEKKAIKNTPLRIKQIVLEDLNKVDRCTTCHLGMEYEKKPYKMNPYKSHPDPTKHPFDQFPFDRFGCTICHEGQGRATTKDDAHGDVDFWDRPMLRGIYLQASCLKCHDNPDLHGAEIAMKGKKLFEENDCYQCHKIGDKGESVGTELTREGLKTKHHFDFTHVKGEHTIANWQFEHLKNPEAVVPDSVMPNLEISDEDAKALTVYLLSLTGEEVPEEYIASLKRGPIPALSRKVTKPEMSSGEKLYIEMNCYYCHKIKGEGGDEAPDLTKVGSRRDADWLTKHFEDPRSITRHSFMPDYKLTAEQIKALTEYMLSLK